MASSGVWNTKYSCGQSQAERKGHVAGDVLLTSDAFWSLMRIVAPTFLSLTRFFSTSMILSLGTTNCKGQPAGKLSSTLAGSLTLILDVMPVAKKQKKF